MAKRGKVDFKDKDNGYKDLLSRLEAVKSMHVFVGFTRDSGEYRGKGKPVTVATIAAINERGTATIPARPFMLKTMTDNKKKIGKLSERLLGDFLDGRITLEAALNIMGLKISAWMKEKILTGGWVKNSPATIKKKGLGKKPLIDTSVMVNAVTHEIREEEK